MKKKKKGPRKWKKTPRKKEIYREAWGEGEQKGSKQGKRESDLNREPPKVGKKGVPEDAKLYELQ